jgi:hypothetical protein
MTIFPALCSERNNKYRTIVVILTAVLVLVLVVVVVNNHLQLPEFLVKIFLLHHSLLLCNSVKRDLSPGANDTEFWRGWR